MTTNTTHPTPARCRMARSARGFSLLELTLVIAIMGILMGVVAFSLLGQSDAARVEATKLRMSQLQTAIEGEIAMSGTAPTGLNILVASNKIKADSILDEWDSPFYYAPKPAGQAPAFDLRSPGPDRTMQTEDDINLWDFASQ
ncbi:MAG: type II secretion system protein GspG [Planctomycetota bacterium]